MARWNSKHQVLLCTLVLVPVIVLVSVALQRYSSTLMAGEWNRALFEGLGRNKQASKVSSQQSATSCELLTCVENQFSFFMHTGAANVVPAKICVQNKLVLGTVLNNAGYGINIVVLDGTKGEVIKTGHFDMYGGDVKTLIDFLKSIEKSSIVLMATYDDSSTKLNDEARKAIAELGSSHIQSLGFRDNWLFVGGKGVAGKSNFEKYLKNDQSTNKYDGWPEIIELQGCIPSFLE
uniref:ILEI/PANDER domain-containing protein n=2 Tax=Monopterus albus TaxID=43700 RepID=A0A3Q3JQZ0_MONAL|nr:protein FAM3C-like [Monopterus albus]